MLLSTCSTLGTYGIGYTLNKLTLGFLFYGDKVTVISVYYFFKLVYIVMLFALGIIWQSSFFKQLHVIVKFKTTHLAKLDSATFIFYNAVLLASEVFFYCLGMI